MAGDKCTSLQAQKVSLGLGMII